MAELDAITYQRHSAPGEIDSVTSGGLRDVGVAAPSEIASVISRPVKPSYPSGREAVCISESKATLDSARDRHIFLQEQMNGERIQT